MASMYQWVSAVAVGVGSVVVTVSDASAATVHAGLHIYNTLVSPADYNQHLSVSEGGLVGNGEWNNSTDNPIIEWKITDNGGGSFTYEYTFGDYNAAAGTIGNLTKELSHMYVEVSDILTSIPGLVIGDFEPGSQGQSHPGLPGDIHAIDVGVGKTFSFSFTVDVAPVWGNFYAKNGNNGVGQWAHNRGFSASPQQTATPDYFIARPDSVSIVPLPAAAWAGLGLLSLVVLPTLRNREKASAAL